jgi:hypothetical protein
MPSREFDYDAVCDSIRRILNQPGYDNYDEDVKHTAGPVLVRLAWHAAGTYGKLIWYQISILEPLLLQLSWLCYFFVIYQIKRLTRVAQMVPEWDMRPKVGTRPTQDFNMPEYF